MEYGSEEGYQAWVARREDVIAAHREKHPRSETPTGQVLHAPDPLAAERRFFEDRAAARTQVIGRTADILAEVDVLLAN